LHGTFVLITGPLQAQPLQFCVAETLPSDPQLTDLK
jgi:hypothetical protein